MLPGLIVQPGDASATAGSTVAAGTTSAANTGDNGDTVDYTTPASIPSTTTTTTTDAAAPLTDATTEVTSAPSTEAATTSQPTPTAENSNEDKTLFVTPETETFIPLSADHVSTPLPLRIATVSPAAMAALPPINSAARPSAARPSTGPNGRPVQWYPAVPSLPLSEPPRAQPSPLPVQPMSFPPGAGSGAPSAPLAERNENSWAAGPPRQIHRQPAAQPPGFVETVGQTAIDVAKRLFSWPF